MQNFPEDLVLFVRKNSDDPLTKVCGFGVGFMYTILTMAVMTGSPRQSGWKQMVRWSERSWLQCAKSLVAASIAAQESQSTGSKTKQSWEEGNTSDWEQQRCSCLSADNFCRVQTRHWTPSCVCYMRQALSKVRGCRSEHRGCTWWEGLEVDELRASQRWDMVRVRP